MRRSIFLSVLVACTNDPDLNVIVTRDGVQNAELRLCAAGVGCRDYGMIFDAANDTEKTFGIFIHDDTTDLEVWLRQLSDTHCLSASRGVDVTFDLRGETVAGHCDPMDGCGELRTTCVPP